jgi:hypothetical protein
MYQAREALADTVVKAARAPLPEDSQTLFHEQAPAGGREAALTSEVISERWFKSFTSCCRGLGGKRGTIRSASVRNNGSWPSQCKLTIPPMQFLDDGEIIRPLLATGCLEGLYESFLNFFLLFRSFP